MTSTLNMPITPALWSAIELLSVWWSASSEVRTENCSTSQINALETSLYSWFVSRSLEI